MMISPKMEALVAINLLTESDRGWVNFEKPLAAKERGKRVRKKGLAKA